MDLSTLMQRRTIDPDTDCWLLRVSSKWAYPSPVSVNGALVQAHRYVWQETVGPIPEGMQLARRCRVYACVNPAHMVLLPPGERLQSQYEGRGAGSEVGDTNRTKTHCPEGHFYSDPDVLEVWTDAKGGKHRKCGKCRRARARAKYAEAKAKEEQRQADLLEEFNRKMRVLEDPQAAAIAAFQNPVPRSEAAL